MSNTATLPAPEAAAPAAAPTLEALARAVQAQAAELAALRERLEDLEDLRELEAAEARARAAGEVPIPWEQVRRELPDLSDADFAAEARLTDGGSPPAHA